MFLKKKTGTIVTIKGKQYIDYDEYKRLSNDRDRWKKEFYSEMETANMLIGALGTIGQTKDIYEAWHIVSVTTARLAGVPEEKILHNLEEAERFFTRES